MILCLSISYVVAGGAVANANSRQKTLSSNKQLESLATPSNFVLLSPVPKLQLHTQQMKSSASYDHGSHKTSK